MGYNVGVQKNACFFMSQNIKKTAERREKAKMNYVKLGRSELLVPRICLGCMGFWIPIIHGPSEKRPVRKL